MDFFVCEYVKTSVTLELLNLKLTDTFHYENTPIQIHRKFHLKNWKFSDKKLT